MNGDESNREVPRLSLVGRESERAVLQRFVEARDGTVCMVLSGDAGIGKTTVWQTGLEVAHAQGHRILFTRASQAEAALSFAGLADLVDGIDADVLARLPPPQLEAVEVALRRRAPAVVAPDRFAISAGFLGALRLLSGQEKVLVAIDDLPWLDHASTETLLYAARRLSGSRVKFLVTRRTEPRSELEKILPPAGVQQIALGALSFGAIGRLLSERLGPVVPRRIIRQVHETSQGNPLFALELACLLAEGRVPEIGSELPVPDLVEDLFGARARALTRPVRRALLAVSLSAGLTESEFVSLLDRHSLEDAIASGMMVIERSRVRPSHPMLAAAVRRTSSADERRALHRELAGAVAEPTLQARHLALATDAPDAAVAGTVAAAAELAARRGAINEAQELGALALRTTPRSAPNRADRVISLARFHSRAGDYVSLTELLAAEMAELPPGRPRALAHLLLAESALGDQEEVHIDLALSGAAGDPEVRARGIAAWAGYLVVTQVERIDQAELLVREAVPAARLAGAEVEGEVMVADAWVRIMRGRPLDDLLLTGPVPARTTETYQGGIGRAFGVRHAFRGELDQARAIFERLVALAEERGELRFTMQMHMQRCELELRAGDVRRASGFLEEFDHTPHGEVTLEEILMMSIRLRAVLAAVAGETAEAKRWTASVLAANSPPASTWDRLEATRAGGLAALLTHDLGEAVQSLQAVWEHTLREHVGDPGAFPVAADLVEALIQIGQLDEATQVTRELQRRSEDQHHPWGLATAKRCASALELTAGY